MVVNKILLWLVPILHTVLLAQLDMEQEHLLDMERQHLPQGMVQQHALHPLVLILQLYKEQHHLVPHHHTPRALFSPKQRMASHHLIHQDQDMGLLLILQLMPHNSQAIHHSPIPTHSSHQQCTHSNLLDLTTLPLPLVNIHSRHTILAKAQHTCRVVSRRLCMYNSLLSSVTVEGTK